MAVNGKLKPTGPTELWNKLNQLKQLKGKPCDVDQKNKECCRLHTLHGKATFAMKAEGVLMAGVK